MSHDHVGIVVADATRPGAEKVPARRVRSNEWQLLRSPLYAMGVASGDVVRMRDEKTGEFEILARGGNVCVQFYMADAECNDAEKAAKVAADIARSVEGLGGSLDAFVAGLIAFTIPVTVGFPKIETVFADAVSRNPGTLWQYGNVYDAATGEPLGWWK